VVATAEAAEEADVAEGKNKSAAQPRTLKITWVKSGIGHGKDQKATIQSLGLRRLHQTVECPDSPQVRGQIFKIKHLVTVEES
jgi:large subunit ribosomal protein L30